MAKGQWKMVNGTEVCISILHNLFIRSTMKFIPLPGVFKLVNKTASIIEINGNRYDAVSGRLVGVAKKAANHIRRPIDGLSIDGFKPAKVVKKSAVRRSIHAWQRKPERSRTLMRNSVKKPARGQTESEVKTRGLLPNYAREARAADVVKDSKVQRFGMLSFSSKSKGGQAKIGEIMPRGANFLAATSASISTTLPAIGSASHRKLERLLDYALANADAHKKAEQSRRSHRKYFGRLPRWAAVCLLIFVLAIVLSLFVWYKVPVASMKLAATKAHINASLPTLPEGFKASQSKVEDNSVVTEASNGNLKLRYIQKLSQEPISSLVAASAAANMPVQTSVDNSGCTSLSYTDQVNHKNVATTVSEGVKKTIEAPTTVDSQQLRQSVCH